ncbi:MAG: reverse transcriptase domain-containing protein [Bacteroidia bacterium]
MTIPPTATVTLEELFHAYYDCRSNKRNTANSIAFELNYESKLIRLCEEINNGSYTPGRSIAFIVEKPVKREIFAADFRDRVVHHLIINKLNPLFEKQFIYDSYSCRVNKGTHFGIKRVTRFIRQCSQNYQLPCYILKLDIEGFFMHIDKEILFTALHSFINEKYTHPDKELILELCKKIIFNDPTKNCFIKGKKSDWNNLPSAKSLFNSPVNCGLPIGNLTSQIFANFYLDGFDHYIKNNLSVASSRQRDCGDRIMYGRYVDDFVIVHNDKEYLKSLIPNIQYFLLTTLHLNLHPRKIYLQPCENGVKFLGAVIKPGRTYIASRTKGNFYNAIVRWNKLLKENNNKLSAEDLNLFLSSMNSYLGIMKHYETYKLRKKMLLQHLSGYFWNDIYISGGYSKLVLKARRVHPLNTSCRMSLSDWRGAKREGIY